MSANGKRPAGGATRLIRDLDHLTDSFAGVSALRRAIFEIAVTGELTAGTHQSAWRRVPLADFGEFSGGSTPSKARGAFWGGDVPWISPKDMKTPEIGDTEDKVTRLALSEGRLRLLPTGSVVLVVRSGILRRTVPVAVTTVSATLNQDMKGLIPRADIDPRFVRLLFRGCERTILETYVKGGTTVQSIKWDQLLALELPLPPLAEQKRIVAKVDQLMALCDDLEAKQTKKRDLATQSTRSALTALTSAKTDADLVNAWKRASREFVLLAGTAEYVDGLRSIVRDLAIRGRLTARGTGPSGKEILEGISEETDRASANGRARNVALPAIEVPPFPLPDTWTWTRLGELCVKVADGPHFSPKYVHDPSQGVLFLSGRNIRANGFDLSDLKYVSRQDHLRFCERVLPEKGDVLYTKGGTTGIALVNDLDAEFSVWVHVAVLKLAKQSVSPEYVALALNAPHCYNQSQTLTHGIGNRDLGLTRMVLITLPLPPYEEQQRIVRRAKELLVLCDDLEAKLRKQEETATRLAESLAAAVAA